MTKERILTEIRRTAAANNGVPLGQERFLAETGIQPSDWTGKFWARWGDALLEAGFQPNQLKTARSDEDLLGNLANLTRELGRFPVVTEMKLRARNDPGFPWHNTLRRLGGKLQLAKRLKDFCDETGQADVASLCEAVIESSVTPDDTDNGEQRGTIGYVYLVRHGSRREYKIGRTTNPIRREGELRTELPEQLLPVHQIETDDPAGIEKYWHTRFAAKRKNGEWFALDANDVRAFKRWRRIY